MDKTHYIEEVVKSFYDKAREDILIGFHFTHIKNFDEHIPRICEFWEIQLLGKTERPSTGAFKLIQKHEYLKFNQGQLDRWVKLFGEVLEEKEDSFKLRDDWRDKISSFKKQFEKSPKLLGL